jgi:hypothetical protein
MSSAVCTSPQASTTTRLIDIGQSSSQVSPAVSEPSSHISLGVNGVSVCNASACNNVNNTNTIATSCNENLKRLLISASTMSYHCLHFLIVRNK